MLHRPVPIPFGLTVRELEVLDAISVGWSNTQAAHALRITPRTVATHVEHLLAKTGAPNRAAAARLAARLGLLVRGPAAAPQGNKHTIPAEPPGTHPRARSAC